MFLRFFFCLLQLIHERIKCTFDLISEDIYIYMFNKLNEYTNGRYVCWVIVALTKDKCITEKKKMKEINDRMNMVLLLNKQ